MPRPLIYNATLLERTDLAPTLAVFRVRMDQVPPLAEEWFEPGQYVALGLNHDEPGPSSVQRAFSIASEPEERRWLEFYIRWVPHPETAHPFTHLLWRTVPGDRIHVGRRCAGRFTLRHTVGPDDRRIKFFVAAGTGLTPFMSIIRSQHRKLPRRPQGRLVLLHGASHAHELGYREELERSLRELGGEYIPTVSRPESSSGWTGAKGRVAARLEDDRLEKLERRIGLEAGGLSPANAVVYVCGFKGTITESLVRLAGRGFVPEDHRVKRLLGIRDGTPSSFFFEQYDTEAIIAPGDQALIERLSRDLAAAVPQDELAEDGSVKLR